MGTAVKTGLSDERAARFMVALRQGSTPHLFGVKARSVEAYCAIHSEYAREARPLIEVNAKAALLRKGDALRSTTHCRAGLHPMTADNVFFDGTHGRRRCIACRKASSMRASLMTTGVAEKVKQALLAGASLGQITGGKPLGGGKVNRGLVITSFKIVRRYRHENQDFDQFVSEVTKNNISRGLRLRFLRIKNEAAREQKNDYVVIRSMLPSNLPSDVRDDVIQSIFVALLDGSLKRDEVKRRLPEFVTAYNRDANRNGVGKYGLRSVDAPAYADGSTTIAETVCRGLWD